MEYNGRQSDKCYVMTKKRAHEPPHAICLVERELFDSLLHHSLPPHLTRYLSRLSHRESPDKTAKMVKTSVLNDALNAINNAEKAGKRQVLIRPSSKVIVKFLTVMQRHGYIGEFEEVDDHRNGKIVIQLNGRVNKTGVISPRYNVQLRDMEKWVVKLLPSRQFGYIVLTTSAGIMDHEEARRKHVAGKVLGFFY
ncbi:40S ribosomal protein S22 [Pyrenophora teres f. teres]|nr:40S ribosomal protein S22 [Pyrenophora teres f. teres]